MWLHDHELANLAAQASWVSDGISGGISGEEVPVLRSLYLLASAGTDLETLTMLFHWLGDGVVTHEASALASLAEIAQTDLESARIVTTNEWFVDGVTPEEADSLALLVDIAQADPELAKTAVGRPWFAGGGAADGWSSLAVLHAIAQQDLALARDLMLNPWLIDDGPSDEWRTLGLLLSIIRPNLDAPAPAIGITRPIESLHPKDLGRLDLLGAIATRDLGLAGRIAGLPWVQARPLLHSLETLDTIHELVLLDLSLARTLVSYPWLIGADGQPNGKLLQTTLYLGQKDLQLAKRVVSLPWFADTVSEDEFRAFQDFYSIAAKDRELARRITNHPWVTDGISDHEPYALAALSNIAGSNWPLAQATANSPWFVDGVTDGEYVRWMLGLPEAAGNPVAGITGDLRRYLFSALVGLSLGSDRSHALGDVPWIADGLDPQEAVLLIWQPLAEPTKDGDLPVALFTQSKTVSLPLAGDVNIWVASDAPLEGRGDLTAIIGDTARIAEEFLGAPFPTTDIILLNHAGGQRASHTGQIILLDGLGNIDSAADHETAHYYFHAGVGPRWFYEGGADFIQALVKHQTGVQDIESHKINVAIGTEACTNGHRLENIQHLVMLGHPFGCNYSMGENFLRQAHEIMGKDAMGSALREVYLSGLSSVEYLRNRESFVYDALLKHTPAERQEDFRKMYRTLHGGPYGYPQAETPDDHGNEAHNATAIAAGGVVKGSLDYEFDLDYFQFYGEEGQRYRIRVNHETLNPSGLGLFAGDGLSPQNRRWSWRKQTPSGPEIVWVAPWSGAYYVTVRDMNGQAGSYTLAVEVDTPMDDHGDTEATATKVSLGTAVEGVVDDEMDVDVFQFSAAPGQRYVVTVTGGTVKGVRVTTPSQHPYLMGLATFDPAGDSGYSWTGKFDIADSHVAVEGVDGSVGTYTLRISPEG